jgi:hypothetical protein
VGLAHRGPGVGRGGIPRARLVRPAIVAQHAGPRDLGGRRHQRPARRPRSLASLPGSAAGTGQGHRGHRGADREQPSGSPTAGKHACDANTWPPEEAFPRTTRGSGGPTTTVCRTSPDARGIKR